MRLTSFLLISIALHATGLIYPVVLLRPQGETLMTVVFFASEEERNEEFKGDGRAEGQKSKSPEPKPHASSLRAERKDSEENKPPSQPQFPAKISLNAMDVAVGPEVASAGPVLETEGSFLQQPANGSSGKGVSRGKGNSGVGTGSGAGVGDGPGGSRFVQVSYAYSPKPEYPDRARREGREGRVLLQVLVDEQGKSKFIEVNRSSGSEALDRAATEAIKHWRFSPAHYGDKSVESWVKIPIDFRLTDAKN